MPRLGWWLLRTALAGQAASSSLLDYSLAGWLMPMPPPPHWPVLLLKQKQQQAHHRQVDTTPPSPILLTTPHKHHLLPHSKQPGVPTAAATPASQPAGDRLLSPLPPSLSCWQPPISQPASPPLPLSLPRFTGHQPPPQKKLLMTWGRCVPSTDRQTDRQTPVPNHASSASSPAASSLSTACLPAGLPA